MPMTAMLCCQVWLPAWITTTYPVLCVHLLIVVVTSEGEAGVAPFKRCRSKSVLAAVVGAAASPAPAQPYARAVTVEELGQELGVDAADLEVMIAVLGERVDDELSAGQGADLLDMVGAKVRLRA